jgi:hypothetical protein
MISIILDKKNKIYLLYFLLINVLSTLLIIYILTIFYDIKTIQNIYKPNILNNKNIDYYNNQQIDYILVKNILKINNQKFNKNKPLFYIQKRYVSFNYSFLGMVYRIPYTKKNTVIDNRYVIKTRSTTTIIVRVL